MDLTPQVLRDVEFREKLRGYHPDDVDDFLEEVAVALDGLLTRLRAAEAAAAGMPAPAAVPAPAPAPAASNVDESAISRALLLAQRTADLAVAEAEASARQILDEARAEADRILADTQAKVAAMTEEAKASAEASVAELDQRRAGLEREVTALQAWATQHRDRLRDVLSDQLRSLDIWLATSTVPRPATRLAAGAAPVVVDAAPAAPVPAGSDTAPLVSVPAASAAAPTPAPVPPMATRPAGEADSPDMLPTVESTGAVDIDLSATEGEDRLVRPTADVSTGPVAESKDTPAALTSTGGGGDGVVLFDQDGEAVDGLGADGARMAGRYFRQR